MTDIEKLAKILAQSTSAAALKAAEQQARRTVRQFKGYRRAGTKCMRISNHVNFRRAN